MNSEQLKAILDRIYQGTSTPADFSAIIRQIQRALDDSFFEDPPSFQQKKTLDELLSLADRVEEFYK